MLESLAQDASLRSAMNVMDVYPWKHYWIFLKFQIQFGRKMRGNFILESLMYANLQMMKMVQQIQQQTSKKGIRGDLSKLFHCMEKLQMIFGGINDKLENLTDLVEALEQKEASPFAASPVTVPSTSVLSKGYVDKHVYHPYIESHMPGGPSPGKEEKARNVPQNYGPLASKLPTFDGTKNWNTFIFQFERVIKRYGWDENEKLNRLGESFWMIHWIISRHCLNICVVISSISRTK